MEGYDCTFIETNCDTSFKRLEQFYRQNARNQQSSQELIVKFRRGRRTPKALYIIVVKQSVYLLKRLLGSSHYHTIRRAAHRKVLGPQITTALRYRSHLALLLAHIKA